MIVRVRGQRSAERGKYPKFRRRRRSRMRGWRWARSEKQLSANRSSCSSEISCLPALYVLPQSNDLRSPGDISGRGDLRAIATSNFSGRREHKCPNHASTFCNFSPLGHLISVNCLSPLTKADKNEVRRPRDAASWGGSIICGKVDRTAKDTATVSHRGPNA